MEKEQWQEQGQEEQEYLTQTPSIQWFPGHMAKTRRVMKESLGLVDIVVELRDARIPKSSRNPEIEKIVGDKPRLVVFNKADIADPAVTKMWQDYYKSHGVRTLALDCRSGKGLKELVPAVRETLADLLAKRRARGMESRPIRMMIVGVPNVGKSSLINRLAGGKKVKVEDRPGVTRGKQWVRLENGIELLDMPGVLWPKFDDKQVGERLAYTGAIKDDVYDLEWVAMRFLALLRERYPQLLEERFKVTAEESADLEPYDLLELVGRKRGMMMSGGVVNTERAAITVLDEFRSGKIGRISLERPHTATAQPDSEEAR
ncbi:MAG: ribosome biogenesis GTPase YlqF [Negativibacillus sp.]|jgi:ribosome biogenesis GTPase A|nr:ribosome biogenesis GTPase YlqF [Negativibacillus sp.]